MTYEELQSKYPSKRFGDEFMGMIVVRRNQDDQSQWEIYFNHQSYNCMIGNLTKAKQFAANLAEAIKYCEDNE